MTLEELFEALLLLADGETRQLEHFEIDRGGPEVYMCRAWFVGEEEFEPYHVGLD